MLQIVMTLASGASGAAQEASKAGMPQLDLSTFASQIFWLIVVFAAIYAFISLSAAPKIAETLEKRQNQIESDLAKAEKLQAQADGERAEFEKAFEASRARATATIAEKRAGIKAEVEAQNASLTESLNKDATAAENRILAAKEAALTEVQAAAAAVCKDMVSNIAGLDLSDKDIEQVVSGKMAEVTKGTV